MILSKLQVAPPTSHTQREDSLNCSVCEVSLIVKYILLNCDSFRQTHPKYYPTSNLKDLFKGTKLEDTLSFPKEKNKKTFSSKSHQINLFTKIWPNVIKYYHTNP